MMNRTFGLAGPGAARVSAGSTELEARTATMSAVRCAFMSSLGGRGFRDRENRRDSPTRYASTGSVPRRGHWPLIGPPEPGGVKGKTTDPGPPVLHGFRVGRRSYPSRKGL